MPITYVLDREARLVRAVVEGDFTVDDMLDCVTNAAADVGALGYHVVSDHRRIGEPATRPQLEALLARLTRLRGAFAHARWAVVVSKPASFGMMRMFGVMAEQVPMDVRVFTAPEPAERWARDGVEPPPGVATLVAAGG